MLYYITGTKQSIYYLFIYFGFCSLGFEFWILKEKLNVLKLMRNKIIYQTDVHFMKSPFILVRYNQTILDPNSIIPGIHFVNTVMLLLCNFIELVVILFSNFIKTGAHKLFMINTMYTIPRIIAFCSKFREL